MKVIELRGQLVDIDEPICSAVGFFDGLHRGHMTLINEVLRVSQQKGFKTALMTFDHHPLYVLGKIKEEKYLTTMDDRIELLSSLGIDYLFIIHFDEKVSSLNPQDFIHNYLVNCHIKHVVCGFDFRFGNKNCGGIDDLKTCKDFSLSVISEVVYRDEKISSTRIRHILQDGNIDEMNNVLGRRYRIKGNVIKGRYIGHQIGFPTANIDYNDYFLPARGVYAVKFYRGSEIYLGMCNIGFNPTFEALKKPSLEVHIFDFDEDIYGEYVIVEFYTKVRGEVSFKSKEDLIEQLRYDKRYVVEYFKHN